MCVQGRIQGGGGPGGHRTSYTNVDLFSLIEKHESGNSFGGGGMEEGVRACKFYAQHYCRY